MSTLAGVLTAPLSDAIRSLVLESLIIIREKRGHSGTDVPQQPLQLLQITPRSEQACEQDSQHGPT